MNAAATRWKLLQSSPSSSIRPSNSRATVCSSSAGGKQIINATGNPPPVAFKPGQGEPVLILLQLKQVAAALAAAIGPCRGVISARLQVCADACVQVATAIVIAQRQARSLQFQVSIERLGNQVQPVVTGGLDLEAVAIASAWIKPALKGAANVEGTVFRQLIDCNGTGA